MPPTAVLQLDGLVATATYFRGAFDKFGVSPNFAHVGRFKSGAEPYTRTGMSPEARADLGALLDDLYGALLDSLGSARRLPRDSVARLVDEGPFTSAEAWQRGLLDTLLYDTEVDTLALRRGGAAAAQRDLRPLPGGSVGAFAREPRGAGGRRGGDRGRPQPAIARAGCGPRLGDGDRGAAAGPHAQGHQGHRAADRQPGRDDGAFGRHLARGPALPGGQARHREHVRRGRLGRLLLRRRGRQHRGLARDAHGLDRHLRRQVQHPGPLSTSSA